MNPGICNNFMQDSLLPSSASRRMLGTLSTRDRSLSDPAEIPSDGLAHSISCICGCSAGDFVQTAFACIIVVFVACAERLAFKATVDTASSYRFLLPVGLSAAFVLILGWFLAARGVCTLGSDKPPTGAGSNGGKGVRGRGKARLPLCSIIIMGVMDAIGLSGLFVCGAIVPAPLTALLMQVNIPASFVSLCTIRGGKVFGKSHYAGAAMIFSGTIISFLPFWWSRSADASDEGIESTVVFWSCAGYLMSAALGALSDVYKQQILASHDDAVDPMVFNFRLSLSQLAFSLLLLPLTFNLQALLDLPVLARFSWRSFDNILKSIVAGMQCFLGGPVPGNAEAKCGQELGLLVLFVCVGGAMSFALVFLSMVSREGGPTTHICQTVSLVLSFTVLAIYATGSTLPQFTWNSMAGIAVTVFGTVLYRSIPEPDEVDAALKAASENTDLLVWEGEEDPP